MNHSTYTFYKNFLAREDLKKYNDNALLLYALQLKYGIEDIDTVALNSLVDGPNDKKTDLVYINEENSEAIIAQGYFASKYKTSAPSNKASDINTSIPWLISRELDDLPVQIRSAAKELRQKIENGEITRITLWYCHNCPESTNVDDELKTAEHTLSDAIKAKFKDRNVETHSLEVGLKTIEKIYKGLTIAILVCDKVNLGKSKGFESSGPNWTSFTTSIPASLLYRLYTTHKTNLFSANVRDYLGSRKSDSNINNGIKNTAGKTPEDFFVYNNGITALVNDFKYTKNGYLTIDGISIVNGAQTTGAIGSLNTQPDSNISVPVKFIKCDHKATIDSIVKFNNSQNKINAPDFRSSDVVQKRITEEFTKLGKIEYTARRGGASDIVSRTNIVLPSITAGQVLAAFHGDPSTSYNDKTKIWETDSLYSKYFNDQTTAKHIFFAYTLVKAIEDKKFKLMNSTTPLIGTDETLLSYLRSRGSIILFASAIADSLENIIGKKITNKFSTHFSKNISFDDAKANWDTIIGIGASFVNKLQDGLSDGIKNETNINNARRDFVGMMDAIKVANAPMYAKFATVVGI